jgi:hypothetical protein
MRSRHAVEPTKSTITRASSGPRSSWRKWPAPSIVVWGCPAVPGMSSRSGRSAPLVMGSESLNAQRNGLSKLRSDSQASRLGFDSGSSGVAGTRVGNWRAPSLKDSSGNGAS